VVEDLGSSGAATPFAGRQSGVLPQSGLDVVDRTSQEEAATTVREAVAGGSPSPEAALGAAGDLKYHVPGASWPLLSFWSTRPRWHVRRRLSHLRDALPDGPRTVIRAYEKFWVSAHRYDASG
jgi:hypothetical protein